LEPVKPGEGSGEGSLEPEVVGGDITQDEELVDTAEWGDMGVD